MNLVDVTLTEDDWDLLLTRINDGKCTPFIGAGACCGYLPLAKDIAQKWIKEEDNPLKDETDLSRIAQYVAVQRQDPVFPKGDLIRTWFTNISYPDFLAPDEPHGVLADLPLPIYITTNYDDSMVRALRIRGREPHREVCRWNSTIERKLRRQPSIFKGDFEPDPSEPIVFHLHGHNEFVDSLVLTEDDYIDFLVRISEHKHVVLPPLIQGVLAETSLLFIGYSLKDLNFLVLFRGVLNSVFPGSRRRSFTLQLKPDHQLTKEYAEKYFDSMNIKVVWGNACTFAAELGRRWKEFKDKSGDV